MALRISLPRVTRRKPQLNCAREILNKEQVKHWTDVLKDIATGQFIFFGGKNLYLYSTSSDVDIVVIGLSALIYLIIHAIIHMALSELQ